MATNRTFGIIAVLALMLGTGGGAAAGWVAGQAGPPPTGAIGLNGADGASGGTGPQGIPGAQGERGADGTTGARGPAGERGLPGQAGAQGPAGPQGAPGPYGPQGLPGQDGAPGPVGIPGPQGVSGADGIVPFAYIPINNGVVNAASGIMAQHSGSTTGPVEFLQERPWIVDTAGLYRITFSANPNFSTPRVPHAALQIIVSTDYFSSSTATSRENSRTSGEQSTARAEWVGLLNQDDEVRFVMIASYPGGDVTFADVYALFERIG